MLPVLVLLAFGSIELANMVHLRQSLSIAAYEGARVATRPGATSAQADTRIAEILSVRGVAEYTVQYSPAITGSLARGTMISVDIRTTTPAGLGPIRLLAGREVRARTVMVRQ
jgi:Flp pilus assembly protein TadG